MRKHSRAPWSTHQATATDGSYLILRADGGYIGSTGTGIDAEEDARLMASAPEMLEALIDVVKAIEIQRNSADVRVSLDTTYLESVIAKARGEA